MDDFVSYADFGRDFFELAVTEERVLAGVNVLAGQPIDFGPIGVGPGRLAKVRAQGEIRPATSEPRTGDLVRYRVTLPVSLAFSVDLQVETHRFDAELRVPLDLTARACRDLVVFIEVTPPRADEIGLDLNAGGLRASILQRVAGVEGEVRRFVAKYVAREIEKPRIRAARRIDVAGAIDSAWSRIGPSSGSGASETAAEVAGDLATAAASEIEERGGAEA